MGFVTLSNGETVHTSCIQCPDGDTEYECYANDGVNYYGFKDGKWFIYAAGDVLDGQHGAYYLAENQTTTELKTPRPGRRGFIPCPPSRKAKKGL
jgi:hypothetical protein